MKMGAQGIKIQCGGRLGGAEIARTEKYMRRARAPCTPSAPTSTTPPRPPILPMGRIGVKVWICRGEVLDAAAVFRRGRRTRRDARFPAGPDGSVRDATSAGDGSRR